jgi:hypothetical protein
MKALRKRATIAKRTICQVDEALAALGPLPAAKARAVDQVDRSSSQGLGL